MMNDDNKPLYLPKGSIRAIIALGVVFGAVVFVFKTQEFAERLMDLALIAAGFYLGAKVGSEKPES